MLDRGRIRHGEVISSKARIIISLQKILFNISRWVVQAWVIIRIRIVNRTSQFHIGQNQYQQPAVNYAGAPNFRPFFTNNQSGMHQPTMQTTTTRYFDRGTLQPAPEREPIQPNPFTYTDPLPQLLQAGLLTRLRYNREYQPPYPNWLDDKAFSDLNGEIIKKNVWDVTTPMSLVYKALVKVWSTYL